MHECFVIRSHFGSSLQRIGSGCGLLRPPFVIIRMTKALITVRTGDSLSAIHCPIIAGQWLDRLARSHGRELPQHARQLAAARGRKKQQSGSSTDETSTTCSNGHARSLRSHHADGDLGEKTTGRKKQQSGSNTDESACPKVSPCSRDNCGDAVNSCLADRQFKSAATVDCAEPACLKVSPCSIDNCGDGVNSCLADPECSKAQDCAMVPAYGDDDRMMPCAQPSSASLADRSPRVNSCQKAAPDKADTDTALQMLDGDNCKKTSGDDVSAYPLWFDAWKKQKEKEYLFAGGPQRPRLVTECFNLLNRSGSGRITMDEMRPLAQHMGGYLEEYWRKRLGWHVRTSGMQPPARNGSPGFCAHGQ